jgi:hypothetical protein
MSNLRTEGQAADRADDRIVAPTQGPPLLDGRSPPPAALPERGRLLTAWRARRPYEAVSATDRRPRDLRVRREHDAVRLDVVKWHSKNSVPLSPFAVARVLYRATQQEA